MNTDVHPAEASEALRYWRVVVDCWYVRSLRSVAKRVRRSFIALATDDEAGMAQVLKHAEATAAFGPKWIGFEVIESCSVTLPVDITDTQRPRKKQTAK